MAETTAMRVIPSGKIYRQMFDAQLQLNKSLTHVRSKSPTQSTLSVQNGVPIVHLGSDETGHGVLTDRQQTWVKGFPNDHHIENPVLYKQYADYISTKLKEADLLKYDKEVESLPDIVVPAKVGSDIIDRITASRKERHEAAVEDMQQELNVISSNFEPRIKEVSELVLSKLNDDEVEIDKQLNTIQSDTDLVELSMEELTSVWSDVLSHSPFRQGWILELDSTLRSLEDDRIQQVREVFEVYGEKFHKISHLLAPDLKRFLDKEAQVVNQTMLSNRRAYADLFVRLMSADIEREKTQYASWKRRKQDWMILRTKQVVAEFKAYMKSERVKKPEQVDKVLQDMIEDQKSLNQKRVDLILSLAEMKPPSSTKTAVYKWNQTIQSVSQEIENVNQMYLSKLHEEYEKVCQQCLDKMNGLKERLVESGACTTTTVMDVINKDMLPLIGEQQKIFEETLEIMENKLETHGLTMTTDVKSLFKFAQGAAHVWDVHEIGLAKQERALQEKLETCRHTHDNKNQDTEAMLDNVMDKMRQESTEQGLATSLIKALEILERIRLSYEVFHQKQTDIVKTYPDMVKSELDNYDDSVCKFFMLNRLHSEDVHSSLDSDGRESQASVESQDDKKKERKGTPTKRRRGSRRGKDAENLPLVVVEVLTTEKGTKFNVLAVEGKPGVQPEPVKINEDDETPTSKKPLVPHVASIDIPKSVINDVKRNLRLHFLNHLETWVEQALDRSNSVVVAKCEELNSELDLRLHLHQPRAKRAELDIHNVRAAELVMHSERVTRHSKGIQQSLHDLRTRFQAMSQQHNKLANKFRHEIEALEVVFINATKSSRLVALQNELSVKLEKFMSVIRTSLRQFRQHLDKNLQMLRESNARFIKSFKMFSDGGNFCPDEIEDYRKKLEKMSQKIDQVEGSIMSDLEGMESKRLEQGTKVASEFEDRFKSHMFDLVFMEKIARWLTNTQVKIKTEVADSNAQAQKLSSLLQKLERRIDACENPNPDKEKVTPNDLYESLPELFEAVAKRSEYIHCIKAVPRPTSGSAVLQGNPATAVRVGFISDMTAVSKPGKQPSEDPSLSLIKNILKPQVSKAKHLSDSDFDEELLPNPAVGASTTVITTPGLLPPERLKSSLSQCSGKVSRASSSAERRSQGRRSLVVSLDPGQKRLLSAAAAGKSLKATKFDKKYMVFGEKEDEETKVEHFVGIVRKILREALDGLLTTADLYYKTKLTRAVTRPQALQETFDGCAETVVQKLQSYFHQAVEYHNDCLQEFRKQLRQFETLVSHVPSNVIDHLLSDEIKILKEQRDNLRNKYKPLLLQLQQKQTDHQNLLRPTLGHPNQRDTLRSLCEKEKQRHKEFLELVEEQNNELQKCVLEHSSKFIEVLSRTAENQLLMLDDQITVDDVKKGRIPRTLHPTSELMRRRLAGEDLEDGDEEEMIPRGKGTWPGIPLNSLGLDMVTESPELTATVTTIKTTLGHRSVMTAREEAYEDYKTEFYKCLDDLHKEKYLLIKSEERWSDSWQKSVEKVEALY